MLDITLDKFYTIGWVFPAKISIKDFVASFLEGERKSEEFLLKRLNKQKNYVK